MNCKDARSTINDMLDGEQPANVREAEAHCESCPECRPWRAAMRGLQSDLLVEPPELGLDLAAAVMARLPDRHPQSRAILPPGRRLFGWIAAAWGVGAALLAALVAGAASLASPGLGGHLVVWALDAARGVCSSGTSLGLAGVAVIRAAGIAVAATGIPARGAVSVLFLLAVAETAAIGVVVYVRRRFRGASVFA